MLPELYFRIFGQNATSGAFAGVRREVTTTQAAMRGLQSQAALVSRTLGVSFGAIGLISLARSARSAIGEVSDLADAAERAGVSAERLQVLRYAFEQTAGNAEDADAALQKFNVSLGQAALKGGGPAAQAFSALGVSVRDAAGNVRDSSAVFDDVAKKLGGIDDPAQRAALAAMLFGKQAGPELAALLAQSGLAPFRDEMVRTGTLMSDGMVKAADALDNRFKELEQEIGTALKEAAIAAGDAFFYLLDAFNSFGSRKSLGLVADQLKTVNDLMEESYKKIETLKRGGLVFNSDPDLGLGAFAGREESIKAYEARLVSLADRKKALEMESDRLSRSTPKPAFVATVLDPTVFDHGGGDAAKKRGDETVEAIARVYDKLRLQRDALGQTNREQEIANALSEAHVVAASADGEAIAAMAGQLYDFREHLKAADQEAEFFGETLYDAFHAAILEGKSLKEVFGNLLVTLGEAILKAELLGQGPLAGAFGTAPKRSGGLGGLFGKVIGGVGKLFGFAEGGSFQVGGSGGVDSQVVAFRASPDERVSVTKPGQGGGERGIVVHVEASPYFDVRVREVSGPLAQRLAVSTIGDYDEAKSRGARLGR